MKKNKLSLVLNCAGILIFIAMGLNIIPGQNNLLIFLGIACFIISAFAHKWCDQDNDKNEDK